MADERPGEVLQEFEAASRPLWREALVPLDYLALRASAVFRGIGIVHGDGSAVVVIPGFLGSDGYLGTLYGWLERVGYAPYMSGIGRNIDCQHILADRLLATVKRAQEETGGKVHLIGHSLGGVLARSVATTEPERVASVVTLASPFRGVRAHPIILRAATVVRSRIHGREDRPPLHEECYSGFCQCSAVDALRQEFPASVPQMAIYTKTDGVVDWRYCMNQPADNDIRVDGTHTGLVFNPVVYRHIASHLALGREESTDAEERGIRTFG